MQLLVKIIMAIPPKGGVIIGRGAHLILAKHNGFRLRISGSLETCARRVSERMNLDLETARKRVVQVNRARTDFVRKLFQKYPTDATCYDMVLSSDHLKYEQIIRIVLLTMREMGFAIDAESNPPLMAYFS